MSTTEKWGKIRSLYLFFTFQLALETERKKERLSTGIRKHKPEFWSFTLLQQPQNIYHYTVCETWEVLFPWIHLHPVMACKQCCQPLNTAGNLVMAGVKQKCWPQRLSAILQVWEPQWLAPRTGLMGEGNLFFSKSLAQVGTPSCCSGAKGNKPPKNGYGGKFSLIRGGEAYKNKADGERERERLFSTLSQRCLNRTHAHIQSHGSDSYLLATEFNTLRRFVAYSNSHSSPSVTYCLFNFTATVLFYLKYHSIISLTLHLYPWPHLFVSLNLATPLHPHKNAIL